MHPKAPLVLLLSIGALVSGAAVVLFVGGRDRPAEMARGQEFQHLVGGLGFGPAVDLSRCAFGFDPRLAHRCPADVGPVPGGGWFCPEHACSVLDYPGTDAAP